MTAVLLQANHSSTGGGTSATCTLGVGNSSFNPQALTPGSMVLVYAGTPAGARSFTASDPTNGAYNVDVSPGTSQALLSFPNQSSSANTLTVTVVMTSTAAVINIILEEWSGILAASPWDAPAVASGTATSNTTCSVTNGSTLAQQNELVVAVCELNGSSGASFAVSSGGWTAGPASPIPALNNANLASAYILPGASTAAQTATFTWSTAQASKFAIGAYKTFTASALPPIYGTRYVLYNT